MPVLGLDHVNIRTHSPAATMAFFRDALGMALAGLPGTDDFARGGWILDQAGAAVTHVARADQAFPGDEHRSSTPSRGGGAVDHVALRCTGYRTMRARLEALGLRFWENLVERAHLRQIFVEEPSGIVLELGFDANDQD